MQFTSFSLHHWAYCAIVLYANGLGNLLQMYLGGVFVCGPGITELGCGIMTSGRLTGSLIYHLCFLGILMSLFRAICIEK